MDTTGRLACVHGHGRGTWAHWWSDAMRVCADGLRMQTLWTQMSINKKKKKVLTLRVQVGTDGGRGCVACACGWTAYAELVDADEYKK